MYTVPHKLRGGFKQSRVHVFLTFTFFSVYVFDPRYINIQTNGILFDGTHFVEYTCKRRKINIFVK